MGRCLPASPHPPLSQLQDWSVSKDRKMLKYQKSLQSRVMLRAPGKTGGPTQLDLQLGAGWEALGKYVTLLSLG